VLFFVSVGMVFDPAVVVQEPAKLLAVVGIVMVVNPMMAIALVLAFRYPLNTALTVGASLAQIGEFSFILAALGVSLGLLPTQAQSLIVAAEQVGYEARSWGLVIRYNKRAVCRVGNASAIPAATNARF